MPYLNKQNNHKINNNNKPSKTGVDMELYKSLVNKLEIEQNNCLIKEVDEPYSDVEHDSKISLSSSTNSQPLSRNLLSHDDYMVKFVISCVVIKLFLTVETRTENHL